MHFGSRLFVGYSFNELCCPLISDKSCEVDPVVQVLIVVSFFPVAESVHVGVQRGCEA